MKRIFKKLNRRAITTITLMLVIFVMSLGYAALTQYIEIEGMALIDRSWIVKINNVDVNVTNDGVNNSNTFVGSTVTLNASLPKATSTVTYNITVENKGNLKAILHSIEKIEDDNANITYTISGATEGETTLNPGETNVITVTIKVKDGVTSLSDTEKSVMLSFNYVENSKNQGGGTIVPVYDIYYIGETVSLLDGSVWHVIKDSGENEEYVTLLASDSYGEYAFDGDGKTAYNTEKSNNLAYILNNTILPQIKNKMSQNNENSTGTTIRLLTRDEYDDLNRLNKQHLISETWMMPDSTNTTKVYYYTTQITRKTSSETGKVRPVIITLKSNVKTGETLVSQILSHNTAISDEGLDFSVAPTTAGLYYTSTNTEGNQPTYYFRGDVENNYVKFGKQTITTGMCTYNGEPVYGFDGASDFAPEEISESDCENNYVCVVEYYDEETEEYEYDYTLIIGSEYSFCEEWGGYEDTLGNYVSESHVEDIIWRIVRINEDGSIRLAHFPSMLGNEVYSSVDYKTSGKLGPANGMYLGYMYENNTENDIKIVLDNWYEQNMLNYSNYLADSGFCNDRSVFKEERVEGTTGNQIIDYTYYGAYNRINNLKKPQFACPNATDDLFTTSKSGKGNKLLTYPIGLLTADELMYAGLNSGGYSYLGGNSFWTISPNKFQIGSQWGIMFNYAYMYTGDGNSLSSKSIENEAAIVPVINLKMNAKISLNGTGDPGTSTNPYIIVTK